MVEMMLLGSETPGRVPALTGVIIVGEPEAAAQANRLLSPVFEAPALAQCGVDALEALANYLDDLSEVAARSGSCPTRVLSMRQTASATRRTAAQIRRKLPGSWA